MTGYTVEQTDSTGYTVDSVENDGYTVSKHFFVDDMNPMEDTFKDGV